MRTQNDIIWSKVGIALNETSEVIDTRHIANISIVYVATGAGTATIKIQGSNDGSTWVDIAGQTTNYAGVAQNFFHEKTDFNFAYLRSIASAVAGAVNVVATHCIKGA
jgi:hypothetical protein